MQRVENIPLPHVHRVLGAVFVGSPLVCEAYSKFDQATRSFESLEALLAYIRAERELGIKFVNLVAHYQEALGQVRTRTIELKPEKCNGATWRETVEGWGLVQLQLEFKGDTAECRVAVNTERRANAWAQTYPELGAPSLWDWKLIEKRARRLIRVLRSDA